MYTTTASSVYAVSAGTVLWGTKLPLCHAKANASSLVVVQGAVSTNASLVVSSACSTMALNTLNGDVLWELPFGDSQKFSVPSPLLASDGTLYLSANYHTPACSPDDDYGIGNQWGVVAVDAAQAAANGM